MIGKLLWKIKGFAGFYIEAKNYKKLTDAALSELVYNLIENKSNDPVFQKIEKIRNALEKNTSFIDFIEMGAGKKSSGKRYVSEIAKSSLSPMWKCKVLYNLALQVRQGFILELGTSFGISTAYLASADRSSTIHTIEGNSSVFQIANKNFKELGIKNVVQYQGEFDSVLDDILTKTEKIYLAYLDGNHNKDSTLRYINKILTKCHENTIFILDDIHWSTDMLLAWKEICNIKKVSCSLDFYQFGILLFNKKFRGHFKIIKSSYKPFFSNHCLTN